MFLAGLRGLLEPDLEIVGTVTDGLALVAVAERLLPDLVITDVEMRGLGRIEPTRRVLAAVPGVKVLVLSIHAEPSCVRAAFDAGAKGYLTKTSPPEEIERAVRSVLADRFYVGPAVARALVERTALPFESQDPIADVLTLREAEILQLVAEGLGNRQIATRLGLAVSTVRTHLSHLYEKLHLRSRVELALFASQAGGMGDMAE